ncbi:MAG: tryptophan synthase subunit alpha [Acidobacteriota bacterium]
MSRTGAGAGARLAAAFARATAEGRPALIPYITAGDPDLESTADLVRALARGGADVVELGVPFSDPIADGPVNQRAAERALRNGVSLRSVLAVAARLRREGTPPIVLFTYYNPIHRMGLEAFARAAAEAGVDGVLVTDLPPEEAGDLQAHLEPAGVALIFLLAPTSTPERVETACRRGRGFLYFISRTGVTGARDELPRELEEQVGAVRARSRLPVAVGFGISSREQVRAVSRFADGAVVGSALVGLVERAGPAPDRAARVEAFCRELSGR